MLWLWLYFYSFVFFIVISQPVWTEWGQYSTDLFTEKAVDIIQKHDPSQPLFLYLPYQAVHSANSIQPLQAPPDEIKKFSHIQDENRRIFAAMVSSLDNGVGKVCPSFPYWCLPFCLSLLPSLLPLIVYISENFIMARFAAFEQIKLHQILKPAYVPAFLPACLPFCVLPSSH